MNKKEIFLGLVFLIVGFFNWYFLQQFFGDGPMSSESSLWVVAFSILFGAFFGLFSFLVKSKIIIFSGFVVVSVLPIFIFGYNHYLFLSVVLFFILLIFGCWILRRERNLYSLKPRPMWAIRQGLGWFFLALSIVIPLIFYVSPRSEFKLEIPRSFYDKILGQSQSLLFVQMPGFDPEMTVDEFLTAQYLLATKVKAKNTKISNSNNILDFFRDPAFAEALKIARGSDQKYLKNLLSQNKWIFDQSRKALSSALGMEVPGDRKIKDILYEWINKQLVVVTKPYEKYISIGFVFVVFLTLQTLSLPYKWITSFVGLVLVRLCLLFRIARPQKETVEKETFTL